MSSFSSLRSQIYDLTERMLRPQRIPITQRCLCAPAHIGFHGGLIHSYSVDLRPSGIRLRTSCELPRVGEEFLLLLDLPHGIARAVGDVARVMENEGEFAIQFTKLDDATREQMERLIAERLA